LSSILLASLFLATVLTAIISGVVGMAGGITLLSFMSFFLSIEVIIPIHGIVQLTSNTSRCFFLKSKIRRDALLPFLMGAPIGTLAAYYLIKEIPDKNILYLPLIAIITYTLFKPKKLPPIKIPMKAFILVGVVTGLMAPLIGATGPLLAPFFLRDDFSKEEIVATKAASQMLTHLLKIPVFIALAFPYKDYWLPIALMSIGAIIGTRLGIYLLGVASERFFRYLYQGALFLSLFRMAYKALIN